MSLALDRVAAECDATLQWLLSMRLEPWVVVGVAVGTIGPRPGACGQVRKRMLALVESAVVAADQEPPVTPADVRELKDVTTAILLVKRLRRWASAPASKRQPKMSVAHGAFPAPECFCDFDRLVTALCDEEGEEAYATPHNAKFAPIPLLLARRREERTVRFERAANPVFVDAIQGGIPREEVETKLDAVAKALTGLMSHNWFLRLRGEGAPAEAELADCLASVRTAQRAVLRLGVAIEAIRDGTNPPEPTQVRANLPPRPLETSPVSSAIPNLVRFVRQFTQRPLSPDGRAELLRLDEAAFAEVERNGLHVIDVHTGGNHAYGHFGRCRIPAYLGGSAIALSPTDAWFHMMDDLATRIGARQSDTIRKAVGHPVNTENHAPPMPDVTGESPARAPSSAIDRQAKVEVPPTRKAKAPSEDAVTVYRYWFATGMSQTEMARDARLMELLGHPVNQGTISRHLDKVEAWIEAGNVLPNLAEPLGSKPIPMDPERIDMGRRQEGRAKRQRGRRTSNRDE